ncbi:MAG TPA: four helix bundle protein, partial [Prolixibacteraceae bacterium]|nr:four helix bundle protein [Prolixibacteraceae bacterium]
MEERRFNLEDRLIDFTLRIDEVVESLPNTKLGNHIGNQLTRCGSAPALNYGEAQSAESTNDFIHKLKIILKEIRESRICLKIIQKKPMLKPERLNDIIKENNELIAIFL